MAHVVQKIVPSLWFDTQAREAAEFYTAIFDNSRIKNVTELENTPSGGVDYVVFELLGQEFSAISAGPAFTFTEAISLVVKCETQEEIDRYWEALTADGGQPVQCGWLKDRFGLSWQIVPAVMDEMMASGDRQAIARVTQAFLKMKKFDIAALEMAFSGD